MELSILLRSRESHDLHQEEQEVQNDFWASGLRIL